MQWLVCQLPGTTWLVLLLLCVLMLSQILRNVWRMCHNHIDPGCLLEKDADMCVFQHIENLLKGEQQSSRTGQLSSGATAAVVAAGALCHGMQGGGWSWLLQRATTPSTGSLVQGHGCGGCVGPHAQSSQYVTIPAAGGCGRRHEGCAGCMVRAAIPYPAAWVVCHIMVRLQPQVAHGMHKGTTFTLSCPALCQHSCCSAAAIMLLSCSVLYSVSNLVALSQHACYCCRALSCTLSARSLLCPSTRVD